MNLNSRFRMTEGLIDLDLDVQYYQKVYFPYVPTYRRSITKRFPKTCTVSKCLPLKFTLPPGIYQFECWGAKGKVYFGTPGLGAYTKGKIILEKETTFYVYIGASGYYNALKDKYSVLNLGPPGSGGATDVRLNATEHWWDQESLVTRIMVAAGGGSSEWSLSVGGNGGELEGGSSVSQYPNKESPTVGTCKGATQTTSSQCSTYDMDNWGRVPLPGGFGYAGVPTYTSDDGGFGGGGYYGGTSYPYAGAGSGGSSFISGHSGCKAIKDPSTTNNQIEHKDDSIHYSGIVFKNTVMIGGNKTMPLPDGREGIWNETHGAFRITYLSFVPETCKSKFSSFSLRFFVALDVLSIINT